MTTPLAAKLRRLIEADGPISVAAYMAHCLGDPEHGYYMARDPFGAAGDFVTAPEISQMFGEIVGAWLVHVWQLAGAPAQLRLVELGPGRGTLLRDILRVAARRPEFAAALSVHLVETSPALKAKQAEVLAGSAPPLSWHDSFAEVPEGPILLVANEFFDALPIRQFVRVGGAWRERVVGLDGDGELAFGLGPGQLADGPEAAEGAVYEVAPAREAVAAAIARRVADDGVAALVIDYGHASRAPGDTLQAVRGHRFADPLAAPGEADLTAHVDFAALARSAAAEGAAVHGPITQGAFLSALGLAERAARLAADADAAARESVRRAAERLAGPDGMGTLFKVLALSRAGISLPPFRR